MVNQSYSPSLLKAYQQQQGCAAAPRPPWKSCIPLNEEEWLHKPTTNSKASVCRPKVPVLYAENWCRNKTWQSPQARIRYMVKCLPVPLQARASSITPVNSTCCPLTHRLCVWIPISLYFFFFFLASCTSCSKHQHNISRCHCTTHLILGTAAFLTREKCNKTHFLYEFIMTTRLHI